MMLKKIIAGAAACLLTGTVFGQSLNTAKLDSLFDAMTAKTNASGSVAVWKNGETYGRAFGYRYVSPDQQTKIPHDNFTQENVGSISKIFTSTMIFQLIDQGKLALTDTLAKWYPQMPNAGQITVEQLLRHRSGLHNYLEDPVFRMTWTVAKTKEQMLAFFEKAKPDFEPNEKMSYSNTGYVLLQYIIQDITELSYAEAVAQLITGPLGLQHTGVQPETIDAVGENMALSYGVGNGRWTLNPLTHVSGVLGASGVYASPSDLIVFLRALLDGKLISAASLEQMTRIQDRFGMGIMQMNYMNYPGMGHTGGIDAYRSAVIYYKDAGVVFAICTNAQEVPRDDIVRWVHPILFDQPFQIPSFEKLVVDPAILDTYVGTYTSSELPLVIRIFVRGQQLWLQAEGQIAFPQEAVSDSRFRNVQLGAMIEFTAKDTMRLTQGGTYLFTKQDE